MNVIKLCVINAVAVLLLSGCHSASQKSIVHRAPYQETKIVNSAAMRPADVTTVVPVVQTVEQTSPAVTAMPASTVVQSGDQGTIELRKEEMVVGKREVSNGGVVLRTTLQTENVSKPVELRSEDYVIERIPASEAAAWATNGATVFQGQEIYIPLMREEPVAGKRTLVTEKVQINKRIETDAVTVSHPVRSESVEIVKTAPTETGPLSIAATPVAATTTELKDNTVQLTREELVVGKKQIDNGAVRLRKVVTTQDASQPMNLKREEYTVSRTPMGDQPVADTTFTPRQVSLGLVREEPVVGTRNLLTEVVRVRKQAATNTQVVTAGVLKEGFEIVKVAGDSQTVQATATPISTTTTNAVRLGNPSDAK